MTKPSVIEINGHRYDAVTGRLLDSMSKAAGRLGTVTGNVGSIDGVILNKSRGIKKHSQRSIQNLSRRTQRSQTLMRAVVKKPTVKKRATAKKPTIGRNPSRDLRAKLTGLNPRVKHFNNLGLKAKTTDVDKAEIIHQGGHTSAMALSAPMPNLNVNTSHQQLEKLLDYALARADAHKQSLHREAKGPAKILHILPKWLSFGLISLVVLGFVGYIVWQKVPLASLKLASQSAHVQAVLPSYLPMGYSIAGPAKVQNGSVVIKANSSQNGGTITYSIKSNSQDKASIIANNSSANAQVQSYQANGVNVETIKSADRVTAYCSNGGDQISAQAAATMDPNELAKMAASACASN